MADYILYQQMLPAPELITAMTGSSVLIGTLLYTPVKLVLDNQSTTAVVLSISLDCGERKSNGKLLVLVKQSC